LWRQSEGNGETSSQEPRPDVILVDPRMDEFVSNSLKDES